MIITYELTGESFSIKDKGLVVLTAIVKSPESFSTALVTIDNLAPLPSGEEIVGVERFLPITYRAGMGIGIAVKEKKKW